MIATAAFSLTFGSRAGTLVALALFAVAFGSVGVVAVQRLRPGAAGRDRRGPALVTAAIVTVALAIVYVSSFRGFYEIVVIDDRMRLLYALPVGDVDLARADISAARAVPWYKGQWRLEITTVAGHGYESAAASRQVVEAAA